MQEKQNAINSGGDTVTQKLLSPLSILQMKHTNKHKECFREGMPPLPSVS